MMRIALFLLTNLAVVLVASVTLSLLGVGSFIQGSSLNLTSLLIFCAVFGMAGSIVSLLLSKTMAKMSTGTQIIEQPRNQTEAWLMETVAELSQKAGIKMPTVGIFPAMESNAFATGWNRNDALVAVSAGLLQRMSPDEVRAVLAHEIGHVANGDMVTMSLIQGVVNTFVMFFARIIGHTVDQFLKNDEEESSGPGIAYYVVSIVAEILLGILASIIVMRFSRWREFRADAAGASLASSAAMISALQRLKAEQEMPSQMPDTLTAFGIKTGRKSGLAALFASHPPLEERIEALQQAARR
ncbi:heat shock protein HtpX [Oceanospirillum multiglobuliferum]|uniref:Protease HtpX n=1 Tax=Oceanospirillum multiglobuliferum TaxID=64969 RepID=A0A1T4KJJ8_9GAMM|nr:protease HtpX [Oceanospirillum multiglobuliferum]OPX56050.1 zinc metalloprotease HtpX [Oceanospirillum multiglobuliferum]SJZ42543.1 heat shock protein HtpX [Oceanospirillum multiglobuliferum]